MKIVAIVNTSSISKYPELISALERNVGAVDIVKVDKDIGPKDLAQRLREASYAIVGSTPSFVKEFFDLVPDLEYISRQGIGYDNVDVKAAKAAGVKVSTVPGYIEKVDVAEHAAALLMALVKRLFEGNGAVRRNEWSTDRQRLFGMRIHKKKVGVVGFGNTGRAFAHIMGAGYGCEILAYDPYVDEVQIREAGARKVTLDALLAESDCVSLHLGLTPETHHFIDKKRLATMKPGAILINTARGGIADEEMVAEALISGRLGGYGCDVVENEPILMDNALLSSPHAIITPHMAIYNQECNYQLCETVVNDVIVVHSNGAPLNLLV